MHRRGSAEEFRRLAVARYGATGWRRRLLLEFKINRKTLYRWEKLGPRPMVLMALQAPRRAAKMASSGGL